MKYQRKIVDVTNFAIVKIKIYYNSRHISIRLKQNEKTYLQFNKKHKFVNVLNVKNLINYLEINDQYIYHNNYINQIIQLIECQLIEC